MKKYEFLKMDGTSSMDGTKFLDMNDVIKEIHNTAILSERLNVFGAEHDKKMRKLHRKLNKDEPTTLVSVYLNDLAQRILIEQEKEE